MLLALHPWSSLLSPALLGLALLLLLLLLFFLLLSPPSLALLPPGRLGLPLVGESSEFIFSTYPVGTLSPFLSKRLQRYGAIFKTRILGSSTVVSTDPGINKFLLQNEGKLVRSSYPSSFRDILGSYTFAALHGNLHKTIRCAAMSFLNQGKLKENFLQDVQDCALWVLKSWVEKDLVYAQDEVHTYTFNFLAMKLASFKPGDPQTTKMMEDYTCFTRGFSALPIDLPETTYRQAMKGRRNMLTVFKSLIEKRKSESHVAHNDFLNVLLRDVDDAGQSNPEEMMLDIMLAIFLLGHDTTTVVLTMAIKFITDHPNVLQGLQAEHTSIRGTKQENEMLSWDDYKGMQFTQNVINETLRLSNVASSAQREALQEIRIKGFTIPKGWKLMLNSSAMHLDPNLYPHPLKFDPWRWQESPDTNVFTPFGAGQRRCAGANVARLEIAVFLHYLVTLYRWEAAESDRGVQGFGFPAVRMEKRLPLRVQSL